MSSLGGSIKLGKRFFKIATVSKVSSTLKVVWESQATFLFGSIATVRAPSRPSTICIWSGASPAVPSTSSWPA